MDEWGHRLRLKDKGGKEEEKCGGCDARRKKRKVGEACGTRTALEEYDGRKTRLVFKGSPFHMSRSQRTGVQPDFSPLCTS